MLAAVAGLGAFVPSPQTFTGDWRRQAVLGRNDHVISATLQMQSQDALGFTVAVGDGGVKMCDPNVRGLGEQSQRVLGRVELPKRRAAVCQVISEHVISSGWGSDGEEVEGE